MMLTPCGPSAVPTGGAGIACPAGIWSFTCVMIFFLPAIVRAPLDLGDLIEAELDRRLATEDVHEHLELRAVGVDLGDQALEVGKRSRRHAHRIVDRPLEFRLRALAHRLALQDPVD